MKLHRSVAEADPHDAYVVDDSLIDKVWRDLDGQLPRERVSRVVTEVASGFQNATVKAFLPILVHRQAFERLRQEITEMDSSDSRLLDEQNQNTTPLTHPIMNL